MQCLRCERQNLPHQKFCGDCGTPLQHLAGTTQSAPSYTDLQHFLTDARDQQATTSAILRVISSSPNDIQPVFNAIAAAAARLCAVEGVGVYRFDGALIHFAAHHQWTAEHLHAITRVFPQSLEGDSVTARAIRTHSVVHIADISVDPEYRARPIVEAGFRTVASVPMLRAHAAIGAITVTRPDVAPLTERARHRWFLSETCQFCGHLWRHESAAAYSISTASQVFSRRSLPLSDSL